MKDLIGNIREVRHGYTPIIYYCGTVVIGKYWPDIIHDGAKFVVIYTNYAFSEMAGVPESKYWATKEAEDAGV